MLSSYIYTNDLNDPKIIRNITYRTSDMNFIWELNGGGQSVEINFGVHYDDAYRFYKEHLGKRLIVVDQYLDIPVMDGFIADMSITPSGVNVIARCAWFRHSDKKYAFDTTILDQHQGNLSYGTNNFTDDGQDFSEWETTSGDAVYEIEITNDDDSITWGFAGASSNSGQTIAVYQDYALTTAGFNGADPTDKTPSVYEITKCYDHKTTTEIVKEALGEVDFISDNQNNIDETNTVIGFWEPDIEQGGMYPSELIDKLTSMSDSQNRQWNYYVVNGRLDGVKPTLPIPYFKPQTTDSRADWIIKKWMTKSSSATRNINELRNNVRIIYRNMADSNYLTITDAAENTDSQSTYWEREAIISGGDSVPDVANTYRDMYLGKYSQPQMGRPIEISSPYIYNDALQKQPLWFPIKYGKSYFTFDLFASITDLTSRIDGIKSGQATTMEYSVGDNNLRLVLDTQDNRLDALLSRIDAFR